MDMNKIICPHCKNVNVLNNNIKICVFKCPFCGKEVNVNNCCPKSVVTTVQFPDIVYMVCMKESNLNIYPRCVALFYEKSAALVFINKQLNPLLYTFKEMNINKKSI